MAVRKSIIPDVGATCVICNERIDTGDQNIEWTKTKRGNYVFFHGTCYLKECRERRDSNGKNE